MLHHTYDDEKLHDLSSSQVIGIIGDSSETVQFTQFIMKNFQLYKMRNGYQLGSASSVHFIRRKLVESLKSGTPSMINMLVAGYDSCDAIGGQLYTLDFLASSMRVPFGVHGFGGLISLSILDKHHKLTLTEPEAYEVMKMCVREIHQRLFVSLPNFQVKVVNKHGIKNLPPITPATFMMENNVNAVT